MSRPTPPTDAGELREALIELRDQIRLIGFADELPGAEEGRLAQADVLEQLTDFVLPRVGRTDAPLLVAVAGSTGAGKSTLVNSLVGEQVTTTGVRRPTSNSPVLACHPTDADWFNEDVFLPTLPRVRQQGLAMPGKDGLLVLAANERMPKGVALLDTPDVDSVVASHHEFASKFLDAADLWLFVTTSARYADARVWEFLQVARERNTSLAVVLSRVPPADQDKLVTHFHAMLDANGLQDSDRFVIPETKEIANGRLLGKTADPIKNYIIALADDPARRDVVSSRTFLGVLDSFRTRIPALAQQVEVQVAAERALAEQVESAYATALAEVDEDTRSGSLLRGEVLARWQDVAASGEILRSLRVSRGRRREAGHPRRASGRVQALDQAIRDGLEALLVAGAERAAEGVLERWRATPGGAALAATPELERSHEGLRRRARNAVSAWQSKVLELVTAEGLTKRSVAKFVSVDPETLSLVCMVGLLGFGSGQSGEGGAGAAPQRLLRALFGAEALRSIGDRARTDLRGRIGTVFEEEKLRFTQVIEGAGAPEESVAVQLYQATYTLEVTR
ncbi:GTPase [Allonocardiopsis opalescens]|uniref:50S ribosome-binding GTPase n=1 Tax=Allonocardiopsis opalescens TaxID=1144618 RepID=A0A2T0PXS2_9ACTN|nr:GTPase [Allonocardiopsis opalescens]PRX96248.1 50S ribosome-binding GTPase [Allonocardiopsis opalescens]